MRFYETPFAFLVPLFITGLMLGDLLSFSLIWAFPLTLLLVVLAAWLKSIRKLFVPSMAVCFVVFGAVLMQNARYVGATVKTGYGSRLGVIKEADQSNKTWKKVIVQIRSEKVQTNWEKREQRVLLYSRDQLHEGDVILLRNELNQIKNAGNPGEFDAQTYWRSKNITLIGFLGSGDYTLLDRESHRALSGFFRKTRNYLSEEISAHLNEREASLARALILGDKSLLSMETRESFGNAGAMHVLAISGLHVGIIMYLLFFLFKQFPGWISRRKAVVITLVFLWVFAGVTGWSPSVIRASLMFSLLLIGQQWGRSGNPMNTLFFSALILLLIDPLLLFDIGFQLSYGAMLGIFIFFNRIRDLVKSRVWLVNKVWEGTALGISAQVFTIPLVLYHFHQFPNYFWLTNLGIMCLAGVILALGMVFFAIHFVPFLNTVLALLLGGSLYVLFVFVSWVDTLPWSVATGFSLHISEVVLYVCLITILSVYFRNRRIRIASVGLIVLLVVNWQWNRFEASQNSEWIVFNSNVPVVAFKEGDVIRAFHIGDESKAERLIQSYSRVNPGDWKLTSLEPGITKVRLGEKRYTMTRTENGIRIESGGEVWTVRTRYGDMGDSGGNRIDMPYLESDEADHHLSQGAFRVSM